MGIHNYDIMYIYTIDRMKRSNISTKNKQLIMNCVNDLVLENLSKPRLVKYLSYLTIIAEFFTIFFNC